MSQARLLSQFFTKDQVAQNLVHRLFDYLRSIGKNPDHMYFIEPSAGDGAFARLLPPERTVAVEVDPALVERHPEYILADLNEGGFLSLTKEDLGLGGIPNSQIVVVGNPPYSQPRWIGRSSVISLDFLNHAMTMADTVAFILGTTFRRPRTHTKIDHAFHVRHDEDLDRQSYTMDGKPHKVATVFQIWQRDRVERQDDPFLNVLKKGHWGGDWHYVKSTDPSANLRVCHWGSHVTVGRMNNPDETASIVVENQKKFAAHQASGKSMKNYDPDQSHFYLSAVDPWEAYQRFVARRGIFRQVADDRTMGQNPDLTKVDIVRVYLCDETDYYSKGMYYTQSGNLISQPSIRP